MSWIKHYWIWLLIAFLIVGAISGWFVVAFLNKKQFVEKMLPLSKSIQDNYGIQPNITISQSALESRWGNSELTRKANNLFSIKATDSWKAKGGLVYKIATKEYAGTPQEKTIVAEFRSYFSWEDSVNDWADLIASASIYKTAYYYAQQGDVANYGKAVNQAGYSTDVNYPTKMVDFNNAVNSTEVAIG